MDERRLELKVGALALAGIGLAVGLIVSLTGISSGHPFMLYADFGYAGGLPVGSAVKIAGVKVGRVHAVEFRPDAHDDHGRPTPVRLTATIDRSASVALRPDAQGSVGTQGALGESYLELLPGTKPGHLDEGAEIPGIDPPRLDLVLARMFQLLESASSDEAFRNFLIEVARLAHTVDAVIGSNRDDIARFMGDAAQLLGSTKQTMTNLESVSKSAEVFLKSPELHGMVSDVSETAKAARTDLPGLISDARSVMKDLKQASGAMTPEDVAHVKDVLTRLDRFAGQMEQVSTKADNLLGEIDRGEGTLGKVIKDPKVYDDLRSLLADIKAKPWKLVWKE